MTDPADGIAAGVLPVATVPGCRSARGLDLHHLRHRKDGGDHTPPNLTATCFLHHQQAHAGLLEISGRAPDQLRFVRRDPGVVTELFDVRGSQRVRNVDLHPANESAPRAEDAVARFQRIEIETQTRGALVGMGFRPNEAHAAIKQANTHVGHGELTLEGFLRAALRAAPKPKSG